MGAMSAHVHSFTSLYLYLDTKCMLLFFIYKVALRQGDGKLSSNLKWPYMQVWLAEIVLKDDQSIPE